jgi:hypothetical protein
VVPQIIHTAAKARYGKKDGRLFIGKRTQKYGLVADNFNGSNFPVLTQKKQFQFCVFSQDQLFIKAAL